MAAKNREELKSYFASGKRPTQENFTDLIDSVLNIQEDGIHSDGTSIGIGINTPNAKLHVFNTESDGLLIESANWPELNMVSKHSDNNNNSYDYRSKITLDPTSGALQFRLGQGATGVDGAEDTKFVIDPNGNVGVGTATPNQKLDIEGSIEFGTGGATLSSTATDNFTLITNSNIPNTNWRIGSGDGTGALDTNEPYIFSNETFISLMSCDVGIGITNPEYLFQIHSSDNPTLAIGKLNTDTNGKSSLHFLAGDGAYANGFRIEYNKTGSTDRLSFVDGGNIETLSILNGGHIGIGTASPSHKLHVNGTLRVQSGNNELFIYEDDNIPDFISLRTNVGNGIMFHGQPDFPSLSISRINSNVGIGTNDPTNRFHVEGGGGITVRYFPPSDLDPGLTRLHLTTRSSGGGNKSWTLQTAAIGGGYGVAPNAFEIWEYPETQRRFQIQPGGTTILAPYEGNVGVGIHTPSYKLDVNGDIHCHTLHQTSDHRLKQHIQPITSDAVAQLQALRGVTFQRKKKTREDEEPDQRQHFGFIAQEVRDIFPELVYEDHEGMLSLSYTGLIPVLVEAVKALEKEVQTLKNIQQQ